MENKYRYSGTRPFREEDSHLFFGRDSDIKKLTELIVLEELVVLFGKSGYGKSSLLNAGVIPKLRKHERHEVFNIRLIEPAHKNESKRSPLELFIEKLKSEINDTTFLTEKLDIPTELPEDITAKIWFYAKIIQLTRQNSNAITLVFDQFEELTHFSESQIEAFGRSMGALLNLKAPKSVRTLIKQKYDANTTFFTKEERHDLLKPLNLKVVFSLHHDRLNLLDQLKQFLPSVFKYTYELKPLNNIQAREALLKPAAIKGEFISPGFTYTEEATNLIFDSLKDKNQLIEPFQLQLIGQYSEEKIIAKKKRAKSKASGSKKNENQEAAKFELGSKDLGKLETIFKRHYQKVIASLPYGKRGNVRNLIEKVLIIGGNRVPIPEIVVTSQHKVSKATLEGLSEKRLLRSELNTVKDTSYEISHDSLVQPILESAQRRKRRRIWILVIALFLFLIGLLSGWIWDLKYGTESNNIIINPIATSTALPTEGPAPLLVKFTFTKITLKDKPTVINHYWDFGEGGAPSNSDTLIKHTYDIPGTYTVHLHVLGSDSIPRTDKIEITVTEPTKIIPTDDEPEIIKEVITDEEPQIIKEVITDDEDDTEEPIAKAKAYPLQGNVPLTVKFEGSNAGTSGAESTYEWDFGDGTTATSPVVTHTFESPGTYQVKFTVTNKGDRSNIAWVKIIVGPKEIDAPPIAIGLAKFNNDGPQVVEFKGDNSTLVFGELPLVIAFNGSASTDDGTIGSYEWDFGDGQFINGTDIIHTFDTADTYIVKLKVTDDQGKFDIASISVNVDPRTPIPPPTPIDTPEVTPPKPKTVKPPVLPSIECSIWMERFIRVQKINSVSKSVNSNKQISSSIARDSLNIIGISMSEAPYTGGATKNKEPALLFFITTKDMDKDECKVYKFKGELNPSNQDDWFQSQRFKLGELIKDAKSYPKEQVATIRKFIRPDATIDTIGKGTFNNFAEFLEKKRQNNKTLSAYITLMPYSYFDSEIKAEIKNIYNSLDTN